MQHIRLDALNGLCQGSSKSQCDGCVDHAELHRHPLQPDGIIGQGIAVHQCMDIQALAPLLLNQVGKKHFHPPSVRGIKLANV